jgi:SAM-dependent methyltransferase
MDNTHRFSNRVDNYVKYRPGYPAAVLDFLSESTGFSPAWKVADIGSGTGISTALFLDNGNTVYAVEPNDAMREKAEELLGSHPGFITINGAAEQTGLAPSSVDLVIAGQAFHWFEPVAARKEFGRIVRPGGAIALMWNERQVDSDFEKAYEGLLQEFGTDYAQVNHSNITLKEIGAFFQPMPFQLKVTGNQQTFDWERLKGRLLSSSYIPIEENDIYEKMMEQLRRIFVTWQKDGVVYFDYQTKIYLARSGS